MSGFENSEPIKLRVSYRLKANLGDYEQAEVMDEMSGVSHLAKESDLQQAHVKAHEIVAKCALAMEGQIKDIRQLSKLEHLRRVAKEKAIHEYATGQVGKSEAMREVKNDD